MKINSPMMWKLLFGALSLAGTALASPEVQKFVANTLAAMLKSHPFLSGLASILFGFLALVTHNK